jgi:hypothetical protein
MGKSTTSHLSWGDRFALINKYQPTDAKICTAFNVTSDELATARELLQTGTFKVNTALDANKYQGIFDVDTSKQPEQQATVTVHTRPAASAAKPQKTPQKRGRKGDKILKAFEAVPTEPIPVEQFVQQFGVSLAVLRQSKRFDKTGRGIVNVKKDKSTKTLMVWRSAPGKE